MRTSHMTDQGNEDWASHRKSNEKSAAWHLPRHGEVGIKRWFKKQSYQWDIRSDRDKILSGECGRGENGFVFAAEAYDRIAYRPWT